jgi:hypothetical protein
MAMPQVLTTCVRIARMVTSLYMSDFPYLKLLAYEMMGCCDVLLMM